MKSGEPVDGVVDCRFEAAKCLLGPVRGKLLPVLSLGATRSHFIKHNRERGGGTSGGRRNGRKSERAPRTRLGVNLIFYSAGSRRCALVSRPAGLFVPVAGTETPRHLGCETCDVPSRNPEILPSPYAPLRSPFSVDRKNSPRILDPKARP